MKHTFSVLAVFLLLLVFSVGIYAQDELTIASAIEASASDEIEFTILFQLLEETGILEILDDSEAEFTLFAPTDEAFEALLDELEVELDVLLEDTDMLNSLLLYHVVEGALLSEDFEDDMELETLNGASMIVTITSSGDIILDEFATVLEADLELSNGVIHAIDGVLLPPDEGSAEPEGNAESCLVFTEDADTVQVRVGPGENRGVVAFLPADVEFEVLGQASDSAGNIWFKLDKEEATPNRSNAEAWVAADAVETIGNCDDVVDVNAPPVIPITQNQPTAVPSGDGGGDTGGDSGGDTGGDTGTDTSGQIIVAEGRWTRNYAANFDASCQGSGNASIPTTELFSSLTDSLNLVRSGTGFTLGGEIFTFIGDNTYQASEDLGGLFGTIYAHATSTTHMDGRLIFSFTSGGSNCSATLYFTLNR